MQMLKRLMTRKRKGTLSDIVMVSVTAIILLFVGVYAVSFISGLYLPADLYDYSYTSLTNTTTGTVNDTTIQSFTFNVGALATITGETSARTIAVTVNNSGSEPLTVNATLNGASLGTFVATNDTDLTTETFTALTFVPSVVNNVTVGATDEDANVTLDNTVLTYPSATTNTNWGSMYTNLVTNTGVSYDILILVIIISALAIAIAVLRGYGETGYGGRRATV